MTSIDDADSNFKKFLEQHGEEGFLRLFFTNYLYEIVSYYLHSQGDNDDDPAYLMHVNYEGKLRPLADIDKFDSAIKKECAIKANEIVQILRNDGDLRNFISEPLMNPKIRSLLEAAFQALVKLR